MKRFLLSLVVLLAFAGVAFAAPGDSDDSPSPSLEVTVELDSSELTVGSVDNSVTAGLDTAEQYVRNIVTPIISEVGPQADMVIYNFVEVTGILRDQGVDVAELSLLGSEAEKNYTAGCVLYEQASVYVQLALIYAEEANTLEGTEALVLRTRAASAYYTAAVYAERSRGVLDVVLTIGEKGKALVKKLVDKVKDTEDTVDMDGKVSGRYHLRSRTSRFFKRSQVA